RVWKGDNAKATLHLNHGMAEHSLRYDKFASFMVDKGFVVYIQDHRGHGRTKTKDEDKGWFAEKDGWNTICEDSWELDEKIASEYPDLPHFIMGHSMGSFLTRTNLERHSGAYRAAIIMGSGAGQGIVGKIGRSIARSRAKKYGTKHKDEFLNNLIFGSYLKKFDWKTEGPFCWLSTLPEERKKYEEDPDCGFICSSSFYADLIEGLTVANDKNLIADIRKDLPILFQSGDMDPVGGYGKGIMKASSLYKDAGIKDVRVKLYKNGRHEILNDTMFDSVASDAASFLLEFV
ncbi:MAG: alpha/beta fold hydrolase, partial [Candidatus Ornithospirochaeta sp.]